MKTVGGGYVKVPHSRFYKQNENNDYYFYQAAAAHKLGIYLHNLEEIL